jgi:hypothetical protein
VKINLPLEDLTQGEILFLLDLWRDEESDGHPAWQRVFAEINAALVVEAGPPATR